LEHLPGGATTATSSGSAEKNWERMQSKAQAGLDQQGRPVLHMKVGQQSVSIGNSAQNVLTSGAPPQLVQALLRARLHAELQRSSPPAVSERDLARDWFLLQQAMGEEENDHRVTARTVPHPLEPSLSLRSERSDGNRP
jgi:hypothetical protein